VTRESMAINARRGGTTAIAARIYVWGRRGQRELPARTYVAGDDRARR
jgi:hypothetical protein